MPGCPCCPRLSFIHVEPNLIETGMSACQHLELLDWRLVQSSVCPESSKELTHVPHRAEYDMWCSRLTSKEVDAIFAELDRRIPGDN